MTPRLHFKSSEYRQVYSKLLGTIYENKCPDFDIDDVFYEYEGYIPPFKTRKVSK